MEQIVPRATVERIVALDVAERVVVIATGEGVIARPATQQIVPSAAKQDVIAGIAEQLVVVGAAIHRVMAAAGKDGIVAAIAVDRVVTCRAINAGRGIRIDDVQPVAERSVGRREIEHPHSRRDNVVERNDGLPVVDATCGSVGVHLEQRVGPTRHQLHEPSDKRIGSADKSDERDIVDVQHVSADPGREIGDPRTGRGQPRIPIQIVGILPNTAAIDIIGRTVGDVGEVVIASTARNAIGAAIVIDRICTVSAKQRVITGIAGQRGPRCRRGRIDQIIAVATAQGIAAGPTDERVVAGITLNIAPGGGGTRH